MIVGVPKEIKNNEFRVGLTPSGVEMFSKNNHSVLVESNAGVGSGFSNDEYIKAGATIIKTPEELYFKSEMIIKVKEPLKAEYSLIQEGQILFTYFHFASSKELTDAMIKSKAVCIAYETITDDKGRLPLLTPMSEIAGRMSVQQGAKFLEKPQTGKGILLGGVPGVAPGNVTIIGGGVVGTEAAKMAAGLGANVVILDVNIERLRELSNFLPANVTTLASNRANIEKCLRNSDLVIGAVLIPGAQAPKLIKREMLSWMSPGSVIVDVAIDQGGCFETSKPTTHAEPIYIVDQIVHYCVANIPGAVPVTSTKALTNSTLSYGLKIANLGWEAACEDPHIQKGLNIANGNIILNDILIPH